MEFLPEDEPDENDNIVSEKLAFKESYETDLKDRGVNIDSLDDVAAQGVKQLASEIMIRLSDKDRVIFLDSGTRVITRHDDLRIKVIYNANGESIGIIENS